MKSYTVAVEGEYAEHHWCKYNIEAESEAEARIAAVKMFVEDNGYDWTKFTTIINGKVEEKYT